MLDTIIYARNHHLKDGGIILPNRCTLSIVGYGNQQLFDKHVKFWDEVYGLDMSNMREPVLHEPLVDTVDASYILTQPEIILNLDLMTVDLNYSNFTYNFQLKVTKDGHFCSIVAYFDTFFDLENPVTFSTSPMDEPTHWKQVVFFIQNSVDVKVGDIISGALTCRRLRGNARSLDISINVFDRTYTYYLD